MPSHPIHLGCDVHVRVGVKVVDLGVGAHIRATIAHCPNPLPNQVVPNSPPKCKGAENEPKDAEHDAYNVACRQTTSAALFIGVWKSGGP